MRNLRKDSIVKSAVISFKEFERDVKECVSKDVNVEISYDYYEGNYVYFDYPDKLEDELCSNGENIDDVIKEKLSDYYDIDISTINAPTADTISISFKDRSLEILSIETEEGIITVRDATNEDYEKFDEIDR